MGAHLSPPHAPFPHACSGRWAGCLGWLVSSLRWTMCVCLLHGWRLRKASSGGSLSLSYCRRL
jgi:hypothetical protein